MDEQTFDCEAGCGDFNPSSIAGMSQVTENATPQETVYNMDQDEYFADRIVSLIQETDKKKHVLRR